MEITKDPDGYRGSTYFTKEAHGKLKAGPIWDKNEAFGQCCGFPIEGYQKGGESCPDGNCISGGSGISPQGWRFNICQDSYRCQYV